MLPALFLGDLQQDMFVWAGYCMTAITVVLSYLFTVR
jgi:hypothetical protein